MSLLQQPGLNSWDSECSLTAGHAADAIFLQNISNPNKRQTQHNMKCVNSTVASLIKVFPQQFYVKDLFFFFLSVSCLCLSSFVSPPSSSGSFQATVQACFPSRGVKDFQISTFQTPALTLPERCLYEDTINKLTYVIPTLLLFFSQIFPLP